MTIPCRINDMLGDECDAIRANDLCVCKARRSEAKIYNAGNVLHAIICDTVLCSVLGGKPSFNEEQINKAVSDWNDIRSKRAASSVKGADDE